MAFAFVQQNDFDDSASATTIPVTLTGVGAGNLVVVWTTQEGTTTTISVDDGTSTLANGTIQDPGPHGRFSYLLSANSGTRTYTATFGVAVGFRKIIVMEFSYTGSTPTLDAQDATAFATSASLVTGAITTTSNNELVVAAGRASGSLNFSAMQIGGVDAGGSDAPAAGGHAMWYRILSATMSNGTGTASLSGGGNAWIGNIIAFAGQASPPGGAFTQTILRSRLREW